jgi:phenylalanyl-tRNA synthetase beta subunit
MSHQNVLLFIDDVDPVRIRQASMNLAIRSQAAILNEKQVDPELGLDALQEPSLMP